MTTLIQLTSCTEKHITEVNFEKVEFAPFVEPDFPFITTTVDGRELGPEFPDDNVTPRCLALQLGGQAFACFDTDLLRWSVAWTGEFLPMVTMAQISYRDFHNKANQLPAIAGQPKIATGLYPGWTAGEPSFTDPRPPAPHPGDPSWGPLPPETGRWKGVYLTNNGVVLSYRVHDIDIYEHPGSIETDGETVFTRTFRFDGTDVPLSVAINEVSDSVHTELSPNRVEIFHEDGESVTLVTLAGVEESIQLDVVNGRVITANISETEAPLEFTLLIWKGNKDRMTDIDALGADAVFGMPSFKEGAANRWPDIVKTRGKLSPDTSAFVIDRLTLPIPNPWKRNVRGVDVDFFDDGRAAIVTFEGDVWTVDGIDRELHSLSWRRFASGLYEPQSIEIVKDKIYIYGREGIVRLHDLNEDGAADFYENFSSRMAQSIETREWASDMVTKPDGGFYIAKGAALDAGPQGLSEAVMSGFRAGSRHSGSVLEVSENGRQVERFATGLRGPYLGIHPGKGIVTASDQQGNYVPATPIFLVKKGDYFGVPATAHRDPVPEITAPLLWIPHEVDRSGSSQVWVTGGKMGPLNEELIHLSYGRPGLFKVLIDSTGSGVQGGITFIDEAYPAPAMKGAIQPSDGQLYIAGFSLWGSNSPGVAALSRLRYTGLESVLPESFKVGEEGVIIYFDQELDEEAVKKISSYRVERWNYRRSEEYGSGHFKLDGSPGHELLPIFTAYLSDDGKGVFLAIPNMEEVQQMQLSYQLNTSNQTRLDNDFWFTVHHLPSLNLASEGFSEVTKDELFTAASASSAQNPEQREGPATAERGKELFQRSGCVGCHTVDGSKGTGVGPTLKDLYGKERVFQDSSTIIADEKYIRHSLVQPGDQIVRGYEEGMPSFLGILSDNEIKSIVLYIKSLSE